MATADDALNVARSRLGVGPEEFCAWYGAPVGTPWCAIFQSWVLSSIGIPTRYAWVSGLFSEYRNAGRTFDPRNAQPGDLVAFDYDGGGSNAYDHIAMIEYVDRDAAGSPVSIVCIDGNWQNRVQRVRRWYDRPGYAGGIAEIARPTYTTVPVPSPEEDEEMKSLLLVDRRKNPAPVFHAFGNTKVWLSNKDQVDALKFLGVQVVDPAPPAMLDALATLPRDGGFVTPGK